ncbi:hypothetical protein [Anaplasma platys]|uniref:hypothetical protein n=1 Tax=Anaplasma platys TaxID=949 RepID=UPI00145CCC0A|nr:hypothetical protein [Anaplasma platys]
MPYVLQGLLLLHTVVICMEFLITNLRLPDFSRSVKVVCALLYEHLRACKFANVVRAPDLEVAARLWYVRVLYHKHEQV